MPRRKGTSIESNFVAGLVTEKTALAFPPNACTETFNCVFDQKGVITRRPGIDLEPGFQRNTVSNDYTTVEAYTEYLWRAAGGDGDNNLLVVQKGSTLFFYDVGDSVESSTVNLLSTTIEINDFLPTTPGGDAATTPCQYASGNGVLVVTNRYTDPFYISYTASTNTITSAKIFIQYRDLVGLSDSLALTDRPLSNNTAALASENPNHYYNIINQGWHQGFETTDSALEKWVTARTDVPSNADYIGLYRASSTNSFDNARVLAISPGNTPAPKGHFILTLGEADRETALTLDGFTKLSSEDASTTSYTNFTNFPSAYLDGVTSQSAGTCSRYVTGFVVPSNQHSNYTAYGGAVLTTSSRIMAVSVYFPVGSDMCWIRNSTAARTYPSTVTYELRAKQGSAPSSPTDGVVIGTRRVSTITSTYNSTAPFSNFTIPSTDLATFYDHAWVRITADNISTVGSEVTAIDYYVAEIQFFIKTASSAELIITERTSERPQTTAFYAGRAWYAGVSEARFNNTLYYTQIIENEDQYGRCYQANDPTAETYFDLLPNDGGTIRIPDCGGIQKIAAYYGALIVIALNGVWVIRGSGQGVGFTATDYRVEKISSLGSQSPLSVVDVRGLPMWWGEDSIFVLNYNPQFDSFSIDSITDETIKDFYLSIPANNRQYAKGFFDVNNQTVTWLYNNSETLAASDIYKYNAALNLNITSKAFYPWTYTNHDTDHPIIRGGLYAIDGGGISEPRVKFIITWPSTQDEIDDDTANEDVLGFAEHDYDNWQDWTDFEAVPEGVEPADYTSYFITGYRWEGETQKFVQQNYIMVFLEQEENAQAYVQGIFDTASSGNSGKWSSRQFVYNDTLTNRNVNWRRLKIRGKGRSLQLRFTSLSGKPFSIMGWSVNQSVTEEI